MSSSALRRHIARGGERGLNNPGRQSARMPQICLLKRRTMSRTCVAAQRPPRAVGMPRALSCAAIPLYQCAPAARISAITGDSARARASAWATITCLAAARASCVNLPLIGTTNRVVDTMMMV